MKLSWKRFQDTKSDFNKFKVEFRRKMLLFSFLGMRATIPKIEKLLLSLFSTRLRMDE